MIASSNSSLVCLFCFFFNDTATTEIYTLSLHDALPISPPRRPSDRRAARDVLPRGRREQPLRRDDGRERLRQDRKSTRLNSSHSQISYAVFCLKKKKQKNKKKYILNHITTHICT